MCENATGNFSVSAEDVNPLRKDKRGSPFETMDACGGFQTSHRSGEEKENIRLAMKQKKTILAFM